MTVKKTILSNGLTVATDTIENFETISVGIFTNIGSVNETEQQCGISHFVEHMAFKGTTNRTSLEISESIESVGGHMNAYTGKEITAYYAKVLKADSELAVDVISDIIQNSIFDRSEFEKERGVIIQEIKQLNDTPDDLVFDIFQGKCFENHSIGRPILGSIENINALQPSDLDTYLKTNYSTSNMILSASGNIDHDHLVDLANKYTSNLKNFEVKQPAIQKYSGGFIHREKDLEQTHITIGFEGVDHKASDKFDLFVLSMIIGGGMSSRLFQEIREKRGLAYSVFSYTSNYRDTGVFGIYAGCDINSTMDVVKIVRNELNKIERDITAAEIEKAKVQIKASLLMGLESSSARMERLANQHLIHGRFFTSEEIINLVDNVSIETATNAIKKLNASKPTMAVIGKGNNIEGLYEVFN